MLYMNQYCTLLISYDLIMVCMVAVQYATTDAFQDCITSSGVWSRSGQKCFVR